MEVADLFVVNKADRDGADRVVQEILQMLELGEHGAWVPPILKTVATTGEGVRDLREKLRTHRTFLDGPDGASRRRARTRQRLETLVRENLLRNLDALQGERGALEEGAVNVEARREDPIAVARRLADRVKSADLSSPSSTNIRRLAHLGIAVESIGKGGAFWDLLGMREEHREEVASQKVLTSFRPVGESSLELLEPTSEDSTIGKFLKTRGPGIHHVCLDVDDIDALLAQLKAAGVRLVHETPFDGAGGCRVAFVHPSATGGILLELSEKKRSRRV
jgi:methylmalonyl-CoA epimerase